MVQASTTGVGARLSVVVAILSGLMLALSGCMAPYAGGDAGTGTGGPMAAFSVTPTSGTAPLAVSFNGTTSRDPQGLSLTFTWDFGDGSTGTGVTPSHTYADDGVYTVALVVRNSYGVSSSPATRTIVVGNPPPVGAFTWSGVINGSTPVVNEVIAFDASASVDPAGEEVEPKAVIVQYRWEFGDGATALGKKVTHAYATAGNKAVRLEVTDDDGAIDVYVQTVAIGGGGSLEGVSPLEAAVHTPVILTGTGFGPGTGESHVRCADRRAIVISWSDTRIVVHLPVIPTRTDPVAAQWTVVVDNGVDPTYEVTDPGLGFHAVRGILFASDRHRPGSWETEIYVMNPDGSNPTRLTFLTDGSYDFILDEPAWSPDGTRVAFENWPSSSETWIYVMNADGTDVTQLTEGIHPVWSPDGLKIGFCIKETVSDGGEIWVMNEDGTDLYCLLCPSIEGSYYMFSWSPDGTQIAYSCRPSWPAMSVGEPHIYVADADGTDPRLLPLGSKVGQALEPTWSPDGTQIAFRMSEWISPEGVQDSEIYAIRADGTETSPRQLTDNDFEDDYSPAWSPDGRQIAFATDRDDPGGGDYEIYVMNVDGTGQANLTDDPAYDATPAWGIGGH